MANSDDANLQAARAGQVLAHKIHTEVVAPANAPLDVRMNAIAVLAAELAVSNTDSIEMAEKIIDTIAFAAKSALAPGFAYKAQLSKRQ
jgi:hypothetical protein